MEADKPTYAEIKTAVFYSHEKPELLADMIAKALGVTKEGTPAPAPAE